MNLVNTETGEVVELPAVSEKNEVIVRQFTDEVLDMYAKFEAYKQQKEMFEFKLKKLFAENGIKSVDNPYFKVTYIPEHKVKKVDTEKLKEAGWYEAFTKESNVKDSIRVTIKED